MLKALFNFIGRCCNSGNSGSRIALSAPIDKTVKQVINEGPPTRGWEAGFGVAQAYSAVYGHCNASQKITWPENDPAGFLLGSWLSMQRKRHRQGKLSVERIRRLESIGMVWEPQATVWNEYYTCAKAYFSIYGDCNVPVRSVWPKNDPEGLRLGSWLSKQRQLHKRRCLSAERIKKLELIGMIWCVNASSAAVIEHEKPGGISRLE